jgi:hypothetical protein
LAPEKSDIYSNPMTDVQFVLPRLVSLLSVNFPLQNGVEGWV